MKRYLPLCLCLFLSSMAYAEDEGPGFETLKARMAQRRFEEQQKKALKMFEKVDVPVLGIVENMSVHICSECGHEDHIFGSGGGESMSAQYDVDLLGALPLDRAIREGVDAGKPTVAFDPDSRASEIYREVARRIAGKLALRAKDYSAKFPNIVVQQT